MVTTGSDGTIVKYVYGNGLISSYETKANTTEYQTYSYDLRGSVTSVSDENGTVIAEYTYSTYGERTVIEGEATVLGYCARDGVLTETNGLIYMRARYYSTELMRFINEDIITGDISNSNSLNRYAYVEDNPATNVDPFGLCVEFVKKNGHTILDILGFVPGYGEVFDVANGVYYAKEGNVKYAILSFASIVPIVGDVIGKGGKYSSKAVKLVANSDEIEKIVKIAAKESDDVVKVGSEVAEAVVKYSDDAADAIEKTVTFKPNQIHHFLTDKSQKYTQQFQDILSKYDLSLNDGWNLGSLPHQGRHANEYHEYMLSAVNEIDEIAQGSVDVFLEMFEDVKKSIIENPEMLYKAFWKH